MYVIDMSTLNKEGEFGSKEWGEACAAASVKILKAANYRQTSSGPLPSATPIHPPD